MFLISFLLASVYAQVPSCSIGNNRPAFAACVRDGLSDQNGQTGPIDIASACTSFQLDQGAYFSCLCTKATSMVYCYTAYCPGDTSASSATQSQLQFCEAAKPFATLTTAIKAPTQTQSSPSSTSKSTDNSKQATNSGAILQIVPVIISFFIGLMI